MDASDPAAIERIAREHAAADDSHLPGLHRDLATLAAAVLALLPKAQALDALEAALYSTPGSFLMIERLDGGGVAVSATHDDGYGHERETKAGHGPTLMAALDAARKERA